jgi:hypothetical protein
MTLAHTVVTEISKVVLKPASIKRTLPGVKISAKT